MQEEIIYYCDKCESENVELRILVPEKKKVRKPMSSCPHPDTPKVHNAVYTIQQWEMHCKDCGHTVTLTNNPYINQHLATPVNMQVLNEQKPINAYPYPERDDSGNPPPHMRF